MAYSRKPRTEGERPQILFLAISHKPYAICHTLFSPL
jgi:hypothetical protein